MSKKLSSNMEMYLKTIYRLGRDSSPARVKDIATSLGVTMPSVSEAIRTLKDKGLVLHSSYGEVKLSAKGKRVAVGVNERFEVLQRFLVEILGVDEAVAEHEACEIEHVVGNDTYRRLVGFLDYLTTCGRDLKPMIEHFHEFLAFRTAGEACPECELTPKRKTKVS